MIEDAARSSSKIAAVPALKGEDRRCAVTLTPIGGRQLCVQHAEAWVRHLACRECLGSAMVSVTGGIISLMVHSLACAEHHIISEGVGSLCSPETS